MQWIERYREGEGRNDHSKWRDTAGDGNEEQGRTELLDREKIAGTLKKTRASEEEAR